MLQFSLPDGGNLSDLGEINFLWNRRWRHGQVLGHIRTEKKGNQEELIVVFAAVVDPAGPASDLEKFTRRAHEKAQRIFEDMITDEFRAYIKGDDDADSNE